MDKFKSKLFLLSVQDMAKLKALSTATELKDTDVLRVLIEVTYTLYKDSEGKLFENKIKPMVTYAPEPKIKNFYKLLQTLFQRANITAIYEKHPPKHLFLNRVPNTSTTQN